MGRLGAVGKMNLTCGSRSVTSSIAAHGGGYQGDSQELKAATTPQAQHTRPNCVPTPNTCTPLSCWNCSFAAGSFEGAHLTGW